MDILQRCSIHFAVKSIARPGKAQRASSLVTERSQDFLQRQQTCPRMRSLDLPESVMPLEEIRIEVRRLNQNGQLLRDPLTLRFVPQARLFGPKNGIGIIDTIARRNALLAFRLGFLRRSGGWFFSEETTQLRHYLCTGRDR